MEGADLPWQLAAGEQILETLRVPRVDSWTLLAHGRPWLDVHWLAQVGFELVHRMAGFVGLQLAAVAGCFGALALAVRASRVRSELVWPLAVLVLLASRQRIEPRPDLISLLLPSLLLLLFERASEPGATRTRVRNACLAIVLAQCLWTNLHGSFVLGPLLGLAFAIGASLSRGAAFRSGPAWIGALLALGATLGNPRGPYVWSLYRPYLDAVAGRFGLLGVDRPPPAGIEEWRPSFELLGSPYLAGSSLPYLALLAASLLALASPRGLSRPRALVLLLFALFSLAAVRNIGPFAFLALATLPAPLHELLGFASRPLRAVRLALVAASVAASLWLATELATNRFYARRFLASELGPGLLPTAYPEGPVAWLDEAQLPGHAFHNYEAGGYYIWRLERRRMALIDGRMDLLAPDQLARYRRAVASPAAFEELVSEQGITHFFSDITTGDTHGLIPYLEGSPRWRRAYLGATGVVYVQEGTPVPASVSPRPFPAHRLDRLAERLFAPLERFQISLPTAELGLASFHELIGDTSAALALYRQALERVSWLIGPRLLVARLLALCGELAEARAELAVLERLSPGHPALPELREIIRGAEARPAAGNRGAVPAGDGSGLKYLPRGHDEGR